jgi:hypothetical protein
VNKTNKSKCEYITWYKPFTRKSKYERKSDYTVEGGGGDSWGLTPTDVVS